MLSSSQRLLQVAARLQRTNATATATAASNHVGAAAVVRSIATTTRPLAMPLDEFRDRLTRTQRMNEIVGRAWSVKELRRKSYDDLHKLWYVLYKEKNMLLTEANLSRRKSILMVQPERRVKVKKGMAAIKHVLGERKREALAAHALKKKTEKEMMEQNYKNNANSSTTTGMEQAMDCNEHEMLNYDDDDDAEEEEDEYDSDSFQDGISDEGEDEGVDDDEYDSDDDDENENDSDDDKTKK